MGPGAATLLRPARLLFARHGQSTANLLLVISNRDVAHPLTKLGRRQAARLARAVRGDGVQRIFTSPLARALETAEIVGRALAVPVELADALREFDCGIFEGRSDEEAWAAHTAIQREWFELGRPDARIPGGESLTDLRARFVPFVHELARGPLEGSVLLISHGGLLHSLLPEVLDGLERATVQANPLGNGAIVVADVEPDPRLTCRSWPSTPAGVPAWVGRRRQSCSTSGSG